MELCEGGADREVSDANKDEYCQLRSQFKLFFSVAEEVTGLVKGLRDIVDEDLLAPFEPHELERLLIGSPNIDVDAVRAFTDYKAPRAPVSYSSGAAARAASSSEQDDDDDDGAFGERTAVCLWFFEIWRSMDDERKGKLLAFVTGTSRVPLDGFDPPFCIVDGGPVGSSSGGSGGVPLPRTHTCFNQIVLFQYRSFDELNSKIEFALENNSEGFFLS